MKLQLPNKQKSFCRRKAIIQSAAIACFGLALLVSAPAFAAKNPGAAAKDPIVSFMKIAADKMLDAARDGSPKGFLKFILRYTDVGGIALYSLGSYQSGLLQKHRKIYFRGMARHITRYFTQQSRQYRIARAEIGKKSWKVDEAYYIDTKLTLVTGSSYNVRWQIVRRNNSFKISNVRILGFWLARFQRNQFENYINKQGGRVTALVAVLHNRK